MQLFQSNYLPLLRTCSSFTEFESLINLSSQQLNVKPRQVLSLFQLSVHFQVQSKIVEYAKEHSYVNPAQLFKQIQSKFGGLPETIYLAVKEAQQEVETPLMLFSTEISQKYADNEPDWYEYMWFWENEPL
ncbi:Hypothetical_protein [Hexamita inflata]|uniref:Hypothetical_protein n=1 Tax=Hexamita inflata TaxID=28002 RepID=A0AA86UUA6_9EUKA|nr:Hypothetical protein HINF_LOCUS52516 [Hexamita inflata]